MYDEMYPDTCPASATQRLLMVERPICRWATRRNTLCVWIDVGVTFCRVGNTDAASIGRWRQVSQKKRHICSCEKLMNMADDVPAL